MNVRTLGVVLFVITLVGHAQQAPTDNTQQPPAASPDQPAAQQEAAPAQQEGVSAKRGLAAYHANWDHNHEVYPNTVQQVDPGDLMISQRNCDSLRRPGTVEGVTRAINPNDTNYGGILSEWHRQLMHDLLMSVEFWGLMVSFVAIIGLMVYILWLLRQRDQRLRITVDIVQQLTNSRNYARFHNLRVINIHNDLVGRLNDQYEGELRDGGGVPREVDSASMPGPSLYRSETPRVEVAPGTTSEASSEAEAAGQSRDQNTIPSIAAANEFGIEGDGAIGSFVRGGFTKKPVAPEVGDAPAVQSVAEIALARANADAATASTKTPESEKEDEDMVAKNRRLALQVETLLQQRGALRSQVNQYRQAGASGDLDGVEQPK
jgi:hypothetical protein